MSLNASAASAPGSASGQAQVAITLPDGSIKSFDHAPTGAELAASIGAGLAKAAVGVKVNGAQRDLYLPIEHGAKVEILTPKNPDGLDILRHTTTAQVLARALKELYPGTKLAIGPTVDTGFYYDIETERTISIDDLEKIEARMREIMAEDKTVIREMWARDAAIAMFESRSEPYKAEIIRNAPADDMTEAGKISLYRQGTGDDAFIDLCRGPHAPHFSMLPKSFKLTRVSGAYWKGDSQNQQLTRIYGIQFATDKELQGYLFQQEEAEKRDHRRLGRELDLFHFEEHSPGMLFWHAKGWALYRTIEEFVRSKIQANGYIEVKTPVLVDRSLWEASGHWASYRENMFTVEVDEGKTYAVKPMNCPCHVQIFKQGIKSYRDLPLRMAEFGSCFRNEPSGSLHGIMRVRNFVQDDAHIFCTPEQIVAETKRFCELLKDVYVAFGFTDIAVKLSTRPEKRIGSDVVWDLAEQSLAAATTEAGLTFEYSPGEGAFYGPKLEFVLRDAIGRDWQCGTLQVDFNTAERLGASYIGEDGAKHAPVMLHRAVLGSMERFIGILIEEHAGKFPLWLSPVQAVVTTITNEVDEYAREVHAALVKAGIRAELDLRAEKINAKVRDHSEAKVPLIVAVGTKDREARAVAVRRLGDQGQKIVPLADFLAATVAECRAPESVS